MSSKPKMPADFKQTSLCATRLSGFFLTTVHEQAPETQPADPESIPNQPVVCYLTIRSHQACSLLIS
ncbi:hypothetical protein ALO75_102151 [Pseudomonas syringae pv. coryli]|uniref:Uncharacterized protein n=1 Tax=Pseudomonas syringae pv. coryli TaxID=317659 RepID=A0A0P9P0H7_9PSED|nr:hypothetical protein ALO75_102151 [Pseudomonas syringae pv. coryli]